MRKIKAIWELMRLEHGIMLALAILVGALIAQRTLPTLDKFIFTFFTALFLEASTFALNDYYDVEIDKKNNRTDRPLVRGDLLPKTALYIFFICFPLGILCSYFVNIPCFVIALITAIFAIIYDMILKKIKLLGNFFIAYIMAIPFVFGAAAVMNNSLAFPPAIWIIALIAFLAGAGREIMKDVMDFKGDSERGVKSFPRYIGIRKSNIVSALFYFFAVVLSFIPFLFFGYGLYYQNYYYLFIIILTDVMFLWTILALLKTKEINMKFHRRFTLVAIFIGLLGFLIPVFIW
ncbi:MAG: UbiA family prenyltransferase [Euryarchaeota archaeon]|nr:UbiA family prenyltransferase [Euryarchaeota archaeon]